MSLSPNPRITLVQWNIRWWSSSGMPIMSQITCNGSGPASSATISPLPSGCSAIIVFDQAPRPVAHRDLGAGHDLRGERPADDVAQTQVARVVHDDHRPEVLGQLGVRVVDGDARARAEDVRMAAGVPDVVVPGYRPVAGSSLDPGRLQRGWNEIGASRRSVANAPSRRSSSWTQNFQEPRSMSDSGTSGGAVPFTRVAIPTSPSVGSCPPPSWISETCSNRPSGVVAPNGA